MTEQEEEVKRRAIARKWLRDNGKCASLSTDNYMCTLTANHFGKVHKAQIMGGADDGKTLREWDW
jgi:hypothetical protein